jgi:hypothetical protein
MTKLLINQVKWWQKDGHFNFELYINYLKQRNPCTFYTITRDRDYVNHINSLPKLLLIGKKTHFAKQVRILQELSK